MKSTKNHGIVDEEEDSTVDAKDGLTGKQRAFVQAYIDCLNSTVAARRAKYKGNDVTLAAVGYENLRKPQIRKIIDEEFVERGMSANEVLARLSSHARGDLSPFLTQDVGEVHFDLTTDEAKQNLHLIKKLKSKVRRGVGKTGEEWEETETEIELHDPQAALVHLGRHWGLFLDKTVSGDGVYAEHMEKWVKAITAPR